MHIVRADLRIRICLSLIIGAATHRQQGILRPAFPTRAEACQYNQCCLDFSVNCNGRCKKRFRRCFRNLFYRPDDRLFSGWLL